MNAASEIVERETQKAMSFGVKSNDDVTASEIESKLGVCRFKISVVD